MSLVDEIKQASLAARKAKDTVASSLLTTLFSDVVNVGKNSGNRNTTDAEAVAVVKKFLKGVEETIAAFNGKQDSRLDIAVIEKELLTKFLPTQLTEEQLKKEVEQIAQTIENLSAKHMGLIMKQLKEKFEGQYDGSIASKVVKSLLG